MGELSKADRGENQGTEHLISSAKFRTPDFKVRKFRTPNTKVRNPWPKEAISHTPPQGAKSSAKGAIFAHPIQGAKLQTKSRSSKDSPTQLKSLWNLEHHIPHFGHGEDQRRPFRLPILTDPRPQRAAMGAAPSPPVQAPAIPPSEGEALLSADTPPEATHGTCATSRQARALFLGPLRRGPGSRVLESHPTHLSQSQLQRNLGFQWTCLPRPLSGVP
ncbi:hypothetical protein CK203_027400 [Vitis vinifera]|uniref:Uncharacterized protein n=1 Tax=Vitis vinifera TaxID=29760 RepID=A0A438J9S3_VITVI|nr:hypothetical protein CK203_027400 [Vitis vinifera]